VNWVLSVRLDGVWPAASDHNIANTRPRVKNSYSSFLVLTRYAVTLSPYCESTNAWKPTGIKRFVPTALRRSFELKSISNLVWSCCRLVAVLTKTPERSDLTASFLDPHPLSNRHGGDY
jgi:hypothetical protein